MVGPSTAARKNEGVVARAPRFGADLDNIVLMAMRKDPRARYASVEHLSEDLRRYVENLPVPARPQTMLYRTAKFLGRHRISVATAALFAASLVAGVTFTLYEARRAQRRFLEVRRLANTFLFDIHDRVQVLPGSTLAQEALVKTSLEYLDRLARESGSDPSLLLELTQKVLARLGPG